MVDPAMADGSLLAFNLEGRQAGRSTNQVIASNCPAHCPTQVVNYYIPYRWGMCKPAICGILVSTFSKPTKTQPMGGIRKHCVRKMILSRQLQGCVVLP